MIFNNLDMKKRFVLFAGDTYYPGGGMSDCRGSFETMVEVVDNIPRCDWWHVLDLRAGITHEEPWKSGDQLIDWAKSFDEVA